jgi:hypothetical protein
MTIPATRLHLRRQLETHLADLGYSRPRMKNSTRPEPELVRLNPVRGHIAYGETVLRADLDKQACHERLVSFSQRRTRLRSSILFFIGVAVEDKIDLVTLLVRLGIHEGARGGHVHIVPIDPQPRATARPTVKKQKEQ